MSTTKWSGLGNKGYFEKLSALLTKINLDHSGTLLDTDGSDFEKVLKQAMTTSKSIRIDPALGDKVAALFNEFPIDMSFLGYCDHLIFIDGNWVLKSLLSEAIPRLVVGSHVGFEVTGNVLVIGSSAVSSAIAYGMAQLGFQSIDVASVNASQSKNLVEQLGKHCFNVAFSTVDKDMIRDLPPKYTAVVNSDVFSAELDCLREAAYFNFTLPNSIIIDLSPDGAENNFLSEAQRSKFNCFSRSHIFALCNQIWLEQAFNKHEDIKNLITM